VENVTVKVAIFGMNAKILHSLRTFLNAKFDSYVANSGVYNCSLKEAGTTLSQDFKLFSDDNFFLSNKELTFSSSVTARRSS